MKLLKKLLIAYGVVSGLLVGPALLAVALAVATGSNPLERIQQALAAVADKEPPAVEAVVSVARASGPTGPPEDLQLWHSRLERMGADVQRNVDDLGTEIERLRAAEERVREVEAAATELLSALLDEPIGVADLRTGRAKILERLARRRDEEQRLPRLLATLSAMEPRAIARILGGQGQERFDEEQATRLLAQLPARKAGAILNEMGKTDPSLAGRLVTRLGAASPTDQQQ